MFFRYFKCLLHIWHALKQPFGEFFSLGDQVILADSNLYWLIRIWARFPNSLGQFSCRDSHFLCFLQYLLWDPLEIFFIRYSKVSICIVAELWSSLTTIKFATSLLSHEFCSNSLQLDYEFNPSNEKLGPIFSYGKEHFSSNLSVLLQWSPYSTEEMLLKQVN